MLLARFTPQRHHSLAYGVKFVLAFGTGPVAILLVAKVQAQTGEFTWLYLALAAGAAMATLAALLLPGESSYRPTPALAAHPRCTQAVLPPGHAGDAGVASRAGGEAALRLSLFPGEALRPGRDNPRSG